MPATYCYPGTFGPPHVGHARIAARSAALFPQVEIVCSRNPDKGGEMFSPEESKALWSAYRLPANVRVVTLEEFRAERHPPESVVMIRGIRGPADVAYEGKVLLYNLENFGIGQFFYVVSEPSLASLSSSDMRRAASELDFGAFAGAVVPLVVSALLEKSLGLRRVYLAVGRPGSGKSTVLRRLASGAAGVVHIDTDRFLDGSKELLAARFGTDDLAKVALERGEELKAAIAPLWLAKLASALRAVPKGSCAFVEAGYALKPDMALYRYLGGRIVHFGCGCLDDSRRRLEGRGTPQHLALAESIPDEAGSRRIAAENGLSMSCVDTSQGIEPAVAELARITEGG